MSLHLYNSNRLESLAGAFNSLVSDAPLPPLLPEVVVLQSGGMARWLSMQVAQQSGICANLDCPFPNQFVERIFRKVLGDDDSKTFAPNILQWQLMKILPILIAEPGFSPLHEYLKGASDVKRFRLAGRIADLFDQYTIFRPEMIMAWEKGEGAGWQPSLWRYLREREDCLKNVTHRAELRDRFRCSLLEDSCPEVLEQGRISVFGISSIPVFHLEVLTALSAHLDVHFFLLNPCREFWDDIVPGKIIDKFAAGLQKEPEDLYYHEGNPLLASSGRQGRELLSLLHGVGEWEENDLYLDPLDDEGVPAALRVIQSDILNLRSGPPDGFVMTPADSSIRYHSCHSPMRELEVLHDQLLKMFMDDPDLEPKDILVMVPDIDFYSPLIQSVFSERGQEHPIPFSIADRRLRSEGEVNRAFLGVLNLRKGRMEVNSVLSIMEHDAVRRRFAFTNEDVERIEGWLSEVRVLWGVDAESKAKMGLPATEDNTWRQGLDRLLLGYAMAGGKSRTFGGILPADNVEGNETEVLGRFIDFVELLFTFWHRIGEKRDLRGWSDLLTTLIMELFEPKEDQAREFSQLVEFLAALKERHTEAGFEAEVEYEVIQTCLDKYLSQCGLSTGFLTGVVTFCELLPMRAVPFKCICLLGMNEGDFPRIASTPGFDLIAADPKPGDRSKKSDDRYLFLETILSAREKLYISYVGQSNKDGRILLPSVLVTELLDYFGPIVDDVTGEKIDPVLHHPMHSFSARYFVNDPQLFSFSKCDFRSSCTLSENDAPGQMISVELSELPDEYKNIELEDLVRFFKNPAEFLCRRRLGIHLSGPDTTLGGAESFAVDGLDRYKAGSLLLEQMLSGQRPANTGKILRLQGIMPHGSVGKVEIGKLEKDVYSLAAKVHGLMPGEYVRLADGIVRIGDFTVTGCIEGCEKTGQQVICRFASVKAADEVSGWVKHLFFNSLVGDGDGRQTMIIGNDRAVILDAVPENGAILAELLEMYWLGMRKIIPFFPESSFSYVKEFARKGERNALTRARSTWRGSEFSRGERENPYYKLCLRETEPFDDEFTESAKRFFVPLLDRLRTL